MHWAGCARMLSLCEYYDRRDLSLRMEGDLCKIKRRPIYYRPKMGMVKSRKLEISKIFLFSKMTLFGNRGTADIPTHEWLGQKVSYLSM